MALQAYFDDSTKHIGRRCLVLAGFLHNASTWVDFSKDWSYALRDGRPIDYFKAKEVKAQSGQFRGWGKLDRELKVNQLIGVLNKHAPQSFHVSIDLPTYNELFVKDGVPWGFQTPYWFAFEVMFVKLTQHLKESGATDPVDFILDEQNQITRSVTSLFECLRASQPKEMQPLIRSTPIFRNDKDVLPIQAADMLAWHVQRDSIAGELIPKRWATKALVETGRHNYTNFTKDELEILAQRLEHSSRLNQVSTKKEWLKVMDIIDQESREQSSPTS